MSDEKRKLYADLNQSSWSIKKKLLGVAFQRQQQGLAAARSSSTSEKLKSPDDHIFSVDND